MARSSLEETREALLAAGEDLVRASSHRRSVEAAGALAHLSVTQVAERAGLSRGMIYHLWDSQEDYRRDVLIRIARSTTVGSVVATATTDLASKYPTFEEFVQGVGMSTVEAALANEEWFTFMEAHCYLGNDEVRAAVNEGQAEALAATGALFTHVLDHYGLALRAGWTMDGFVYVLRAYSRGVTLQERASRGTMLDPLSTDVAPNLYLLGLDAILQSAVTEAT